MTVKVQELLRDPDTDKSIWSDFYSVECHNNTDLYTEVEFFTDLVERTEVPIRLEVTV